MMSRFYMVGADQALAQPVLFQRQAEVERFMNHINAETNHWCGDEIGLEIDDEFGAHDPCDALSMFDCVLIVNERVRHVWEPIIPAQLGMWIPAVYQSNRWWILRSVMRLDAVLSEESSIVRSATGVVIAIDRLCLDLSVCDGVDFFRLSNGFESWPQVISRRVMLAGMEAGIRGLRFSPVDSH